MSDVTAAPSTIEQARALFAAEQLPFPPLPERFAAALRAESPHLFATRSLEARPYNLEIYSLEIQQEPAVPDYAVLGFDGYGTNSWAVHYYAVEGALALFIQLPWGGAYVDADDGRRTITAAFTWAEKLHTDVRRARQQGLIPEGWRLLVVASEFAAPGWAWVPPAPTDPEAIAWHDDAGLRRAVDSALADLFAGRTTLPPTDKDDRR
jgi:hypothetical protein